MRTYGSRGPASPVLLVALAACQTDAPPDETRCLEGCDVRAPADAAPTADAGSAPKPWHAIHHVQFLGLFTVASGALVVHSEGAVTLARDETLTSAWASPKALTAAAFDGTRLVVADAKELEVRSLQYEAIRTVTLEGKCDFATFAAEHTVICAPKTHNSDGTVSNYDIESGNLVGRSLGLAYEGMPPLRAVPGREQLAQYSPLALYAMEPAGQLQLLGKGPYGGNNAEFLRSGESTLLLDSGEFVRVSNSRTCDTEPLGCFQTAGLLGLGVGEKIQAFQALADGGLLTVIYSSERHPAAPKVVALQLRDVTTRSIVAQKLYDFGDDSVTAVRYDEVADQVWVVVSEAHSSPGSSFRVRLLDYR